MDRCLCLTHHAGVCCRLLDCDGLSGYLLLYLWHLKKFVKKLSISLTVRIKLGWLKSPLSHLFIFWADGLANRRLCRYGLVIIRWLFSLSLWWDAHRSLLRLFKRCLDTHTIFIVLNSVAMMGWLNPLFSLEQLCCVAACTETYAYVSDTAMYPIWR